MDYAETEVQSMIREAAREFGGEFDQEYIREHVEEKEFPEEYWNEMADRGFLGTMIPEEYGGEGLGMLEMTIILEELARAGDPGGILLVLTAIFGGVGITEHGTESQKEEYLPGIANGDIQFSMGLTESNAGVNTLNIDTYAREEDGEYVVNGGKTFISGVDHADYMLLVARTSEFDSSNPTHGISLFIVPDPGDREEIELNPVEVEVPWSERQFQLDINDLRLDERRLLGGPDSKDIALYHLWDTLNTERIASAAGSLGSGLRAVDLGVEYANDREVFGEPIGAYQGVQHPLADSYTKLLSAREMMYKAAWRYDEDLDAGEAANVAKLRASEAATEAASNSIQAHGGNGFTPEYEVIYLFMNSRLLETVPIPNEMIKNFVAENSLGLPRSYLRG
ncbi:MAG: acyl-CoA dehydrogenase family protein [Halobacteria archaeon]